MMKWESLCKLVSVLRPAEIQAVRSEIRTRGGVRKKFHLKVFDRLLEQPNCGATVISADFRGVTAQDIERSAKALYKVILQSIRSYISKTDVLNDIRLDACQVAWLLERGFSKEAGRLLNNCVVEAKKGEQFALLLELSKLRSRWIVESRPCDCADQLEELFAETQKQLQQLSEIIELQHLNALAYLEFQQGKLEEAQIKLTVIPEVPDMSKYQGSIRAKFNYHTLLELQGELARDMDLALQHKWHKLMLYEHNLSLFSSSDQAYISLLTNFLGASAQADNFSYHGLLFSKLEQLLANGDARANPQYCMLQMQKLIWYYRTAAFEDLLTFLVEKLVPEAELVWKRLNWSQRLVLLYNIAVCFFVLERFEEAFVWFSKVISEVPKMGIRQDIQVGSRLLFLVCCHELGHRVFLQNQYRKVYRQLRRKGLLGPWERNILRLARKLTRAIGRKEVVEAMQICRTECAALAGTQNKSTLGKRELDVWLEARLRDRSLQQCFSERIASIKR